MKEACYMIKKTDETIKEDDWITGKVREIYTGTIYDNWHIAVQDLFFTVGVMKDIDECIFSDNKMVVKKEDGNITYEIIECEIDMPDL